MQGKPGQRYGAQGVGRTAASIGSREIGSNKKTCVKGIVCWDLLIETDEHYLLLKGNSRRDHGNFRNKLGCEYDENFSQIPLRLRRKFSRLNCAPAAAPGRNPWDNCPTPNPRLHSDCFNQIIMITKSTHSFRNLFLYLQILRPPRYASYVCSYIQMEDFQKKKN